MKAETLETREEAVKELLGRIAEAAALCETDVERVAEAAVQLELLPNAKVAVLAIPRCAVRFVSAAEAREQLETTAAIDLSQFGGAVPADEFYYEAK